MRNKQFIKMQGWWIINKQQKCFANLFIAIYFVCFSPFFLILINCLQNCLLEKMWSVSYELNDRESAEKNVDEMQMKQANTL